MLKKRTAITGGAIAILVIINIFVMFNPFNQSSSYEIVETRDFSCPGMTGFTFKYPVFKGWEVATVDTAFQKKGECTIFLDHPQEITLESYPQIIITKAPYSDKEFEAPPVTPNKNNVPYIYTKEDSLFEVKNYGYVIFYDKDLKYWVSLDGISEKSGFPTEQFFKTVIDSFTTLESKN
jgi:hypothetical protein